MFIVEEMDTFWQMHSGQNNHFLTHEKSTKSFEAQKNNIFESLGKENWIQRASMKLFNRTVTITPVLLHFLKTMIFSLDWTLLLRSLVVRYDSTQCLEMVKRTTSKKNRAANALIKKLVTTNLLVLKCSCFMIINFNLIFFFKTATFLLPVNTHSMIHLQVE